MENTPKLNKSQLKFEMKKEIITEDNNKYLIFIKAEYSELIIKAVKIDNIHKEYKNIYTVDQIKANKYFSKFNDLEEICDEILIRIEKEKIVIFEESNNSIILLIPLPSEKIKEIIFELKKEIENDENDENEENEENHEYNEKDENEEKDGNDEKNRNVENDEKDEKDDKKNEKDKKNVNDEKDIIINQLMDIINKQKREIAELKEFKNEVSILLKNYISYLESSIIDNNLYNSVLKKWINRKKKLKANLLYRLTRDGPEISTYHKLCDNKGPTLTLFFLKFGYIVGFYANESIDSFSGWKKDPYNFIFNLKECEKYKVKTDSAFFCGKNNGPSANGLGCNESIDLNYIYFSDAKLLDLTYENGSKIIPDISEYELECEVLETEVFQIIAC